MEQTYGYNTETRQKMSMKVVNLLTYEKPKDLIHTYVFTYSILFLKIYLDFLQIFVKQFGKIFFSFGTFSIHLFIKTSRRF